MLFLCPCKFVAAAVIRSSYEKNKTIHLWRYIEAINKMLLEEKNEDIEYFRITKIQGAKVFIKLVT